MLLQGGLTVRHRTHNPKIGGSIPPSARRKLTNLISYNNSSVKDGIIPKLFYKY